MARYLVLDWDHQQVHVVSATVGGGVRILRAAAWQEHQSPNPIEAEALGQALRERLKAEGIAPAPVIVCLGRDRIILKEVRYPAVAPDEEPGLVRFQAVKELTDPPEEIILDYAPVGESGGERRAAVLVVRREMLMAYQGLCKAAGLKLAAMTPRSYGSAACLKRQLGSSVLTPPPDPPDAAIAFVTASDRWAEFGVVRGDTLVFARSLAVGPGMAGEVRRNLAVYTGQAPQQPVRALYVAGGSEHAALRDRLKDMLGVPVYAFDPFGGEERPELPAANRGAFAGAVGLLQLLANRRELPINFVAPKEPKPPRDPNRRRLAIAAAVAAFLLVGLVSFCYAKLSEKDAVLEKLFIQKANLDKQLVQLQEDEKRLQALDEWNRGGVVWLDELYDLTDRFPDPNNMRLVQLSATPLQRTAKDRHVARMELKGVTTEDHQAVDTLNSRMVQDGHYRVDPKQLALNTGLERLRFRQQFTMRVDVEKQPPSMYTRRLTVAPPPEDPDRGRGPARGRRGGAPGGMDFGFGLRGDVP